jgi:hypothetical protein
VRSAATAPAARVDPPRRGGGCDAGSASEQAGAALPRRESETQADHRPQTEVLSTQLLETELVPSQAPGAETQLPSPPAPEPQQAPDEQMQEAQEPETLSAMLSAGDAGLPSRPEAQSLDGRAEPAAEGRAEPAVQSGAEPPPLSLEQARASPLLRCLTARASAEQAPAPADVS